MSTCNPQGGATLAGVGRQGLSPPSGEAATQGGVVDEHDHGVQPC